ncbi:hypothetical protein AX777_05845 [Sphingobium yanoikuyae]|uniref:Uncharacterized protein n=1 Tax=Sphingobium yanoikuyae TaxID=13690 RepID=A0A177JN39_SPHYA|nr:hypothetical protein AX777_05845 [Sphingobium yanoikuyae]
MAGAINSDAYDANAIFTGSARAAATCWEKCFPDRAVAHFQFNSQVFDVEVSNIGASRTGSARRSGRASITLRTLRTGNRRSCASRASRTHRANVAGIAFRSLWTRYSRCSTGRASCTSVTLRTLSAG